MLRSPHRHFQPTGTLSSPQRTRVKSVFGIYPHDFWFADFTGSPVPSATSGFPRTKDAFWHWSANSAVKARPVRAKCLSGTRTARRTTHGNRQGVPYTRRSADGMTPRVVRSPVLCGLRPSHHPRPERSRKHATSPDNRGDLRTTSSGHGSAMSALALTVPRLFIVSSCFSWLAKPRLHAACLLTGSSREENTSQTDASSCAGPSLRRSPVRIKAISRHSQTEIYSIFHKNQELRKSAGYRTRRFRTETRGHLFACALSSIRQARTLPKRKIKNLSF